ncbi:Putative light- and oxygen-sensing transcriptionregulator [Halapricum desulfuricans]|uniref:Light- and oxygen-sensing transcriptionregulator n=1 Tax=Halapricum desulfuricans TaxID=2841257 RepID=A0A897NG81_9EURY|nr:bacterio-opsin activator domain-containing protein [Halapricum desulfuricans]QSG11717.1 Putative light- and oxygen-sensing transcriptionregulator [Halapricum desulfuricans]
MDDRLHAAPIGVLTVSSEGVISHSNETAQELLGGDPSGSPVAESDLRSVEDSLLAAFEESTDEVTFEEYYPGLERWLSVTVTPVDGNVTVYLRDVSRRYRARQTVETLRSERRRTAAIDETRSEVVAELVSSPSREEIERTLARELGERDLWSFVWIGERTDGTAGLDVRAVAGETGDTFPAVRETIERPATTPEERAVEQQQIQVVRSIADEDGIPETIRLAAFSDGVQSMLSVPLTYGSAVHGVVGVYADRVDAFSERERTSFETLGTVAGFAVTAGRNRDLLLSDTVTEVTFEPGADALLVAVAREVDATMALTGTVPHESDALLCYVTPTDGDPDDIAAAASNNPDVGHARVLGDSGTVEIELHRATPLIEVSSLGGTIRRATYEPDDSQIVVEFPPDSDTRRIVTSLTREHDLDVRSKRERERGATTAREFRDGLAERLTERQKTALRTAYFADYFETPRGSTAEEVADLLDITGSTLLYHLRAGQRKLLSAFFDGVGDRGE